MSKSENKIPAYSSIGFGNIGQAPARVFARKGLEVFVATKCDPESFSSAAVGEGGSGHKGAGGMSFFAGGMGIH
jgi:predicted dinucleotide-binding enzyme